MSQETYLFKVGDILKEKDNDSLYRYKVLETGKGTWSPLIGHHTDYVLERQETDYLPVQTHYLSKDFCESNFILISNAQQPAGCEHEWKVYDSGFRTLEYCAKCNKDKA